MQKKSVFYFFVLSHTDPSTWRGFKSLIIIQISFHLRMSW